MASASSTSVGPVAASAARPYDRPMDAVPAVPTEMLAGEKAADEAADRGPEDRRAKPPLALPPCSPPPAAPEWPAPRVGPLRFTGYTLHHCSFTVVQAKAPEWPAPGGGERLARRREGNSVRHQERPAGWSSVLLCLVGLYDVVSDTSSVFRAFVRRGNQPQGDAKVRRNPDTGVWGTL